MICDLRALTAEQRTEHSARTRRLLEAVLERTELADGYDFRFDRTAAPLVEIAQWIELERLCCPFLRFTLDVHAGKASLRLTGAEGVKAVLQAALTFPCG